MFGHFSKSTPTQLSVTFGAYIFASCDWAPNPHQISDHPFGGKIFSSSETCRRFPSFLLSSTLSNLSLPSQAPTSHMALLSLCAGGGTMLHYVLLEHEKQMAAKKRCVRGLRICDQWSCKPSSWLESRYQLYRVLICRSSCSAFSKRGSVDQSTLSTASSGLFPLRGWCLPSVVTKGSPPLSCLLPSPEACLGVWEGVQLQGW